MFGGPHLLTLVTERRAAHCARCVCRSSPCIAEPVPKGSPRSTTALSGYDPTGNRIPMGRPPTPSISAIRSRAPRAVRSARSSAAAKCFRRPRKAKSPRASIASCDDVRLLNADRNGNDGEVENARWLLPMAFPEGSPMHPAYGAGHATVAGACVTMLKAFFAMELNGQKTYLIEPGEGAVVPKADGSGLALLAIPQGLTLEGDLNKLAWNVSNARDIAGVHYYTDYVKSVILGEDIRHRDPARADAVLSGRRDGHGDAAAVHDAQPSRNPVAW